jgi:hypothetical protein
MRKLKSVITETVRASVPALTITVMDNEARVLDTALAEQLGMSAVRNIRSDIIEPNREELEACGTLCSQRLQTGGRPANAFYLNRQQALLVCILSKTEKAKAVRAEVIRRFDAYEELTRPAPVPVEPVFQVPQTFSEALRLAAPVPSSVPRGPCPGRPGVWVVVPAGAVVVGLGVVRAGAVVGGDIGAAIGAVSVH